MLSSIEFNLLKNIKLGKITDLDTITDLYTGAEQNVISNKNLLIDTLHDLSSKNYLENFCITPLGEAELSTFKVKNAIILAAGEGEQSQKAIYSLPKGLYKIKGEPIIERQIKQLKEANINEIILVVGIKKEHYFYLEEKYGVIIIASMNANKNNICSVNSVIQYLDNTYICNCDNYFEENPFEEFEYRTFHATQDKDNTEREYSVQKNINCRITGISIVEFPAECLFGHAYFDREFSYKFKNFLNKEINAFRIDSMFWQEFYAKHITDLDMYAKKYKNGFIHELDSIAQLQEIDTLFIESISALAADKITMALQCTKDDIKDTKISPKGLSNLITTFNVFGNEYVLRFPGTDSDVVFKRNKEVLVQIIAYENNIDNTYVFIDDSGIKIAKFIPDCVDVTDMYYNDMKLMKRLIKKVRILHRVQLNDNQKNELTYEPMLEADKLLEVACQTKGDLFEMFYDIREKAKKLYTYLENDGIEKVVAHNDINPANILLNDNSFEIIDWEFGGYNDPAFDFGRIIDSYEFDDQRIDELLEVYFERPATFIERLHWIGYIAIHGWYYFCWCLYKESIGYETLFWMHYFYIRIKKVLNYALPLYENNL